MGRRIGTSRPPPALVVAILALLAALGGTAVAGSEPSATTAANVGKALKKAKKALKLAKQNARAIEDIELTPGPQGVEGPRGPQGAPGVSGLEKVVGSSGAATSNSFKSATATCPAGKRAVGSGGQVGGLTGPFPNELAEVVITFIEPSGENTVPGSVTVFAAEQVPTIANWSVQATALCANVS